MGVVSFGNANQPSLKRGLPGRDKIPALVDIFEINLDNAVVGADEREAAQLGQNAMGRVSYRHLRVDGDVSSVEPANAPQHCLQTGWDGTHSDRLFAVVNVRNGWWTQVIVATLYLWRGEVCDGEDTTAPHVHCGGECGGLGSLAAW